MSVVSCPHCQSQIPHVPDLVGRQVTCGHCKGVFEMPPASSSPATPPPPAAATPPPTPPPIPPPSSPAPDAVDPAADATASQAATSTPLPTAVEVATPVQASAPVPAAVPASTLGIPSGQSSYRRAVDQRFEPSNSILDLFDWKFQKYVTPMIIRFTWKMVVAIFLCGLVYYMVGPEVWADAGSSSSSGTDFRIPYWMGMLIARILVAVTMILMLLWIRVVLEMMIVIFNIAGGISAIEKNTSGRI